SKEQSVPGARSFSSNDVAKCRQESFLSGRAERDSSRKHSCCHRVPHNGHMAIRDVSDTALWAAVFRARESERADALFRDPYAHRLAGSRGEQIMAEVAHAGDNDWAWVMRTYVFDRVIREELQQGTDMVLNLAAGLDARPYRMELPPHLDWVEMDLPRIFAYKNEILRDERPLCRVEQVSVDLSDADARRAAFARAMTGHSRVLVLSEGLLIYL